MHLPQKLNLHISCHLLALVLCVYGVDCQADYIVGVTSGFVPGAAPTVRIDPLTGSYSTINTGGRSYNSLGQDSAGDLYGGWFSGSAPNGRVSRFDAASGAILETFQAETPGAGDIRGLSFDGADTLFAVVNRDDSSGSPTVDDDLYTIDLAAETTSVVGSLGFRSVQGFDISPSGVMYAWDINDGLLLVDPNTGAATDINPLVNGTLDIQSIVFASDGRLFGARENLFSIDPATGTFAQIGTGIGLDVRGIAWVVPEPATLGLTWLAAGGLLFACSARNFG